MESNLLSGALTVATNAALDAGKIIAQAITQLDRVKVTRKSRTEMVSEIDVVVETQLIEALAEAYPQFSVLAEESGETNKESEYCWIIDPIDGTHNFLHGHPHCAISIALRRVDEIVLAVVYDPLRNELFSARRGRGAQLDGRRIRVSETARLSDSLLCTGFPYRDVADTKPWLRSFATLLPRAQSIHRTGSSVLDLAWIAAGRYDGFWEFGMQDWDIAAGSLLVREAGGLISDISGDTDAMKSGNAVAGNPRIQEKLLQLVQSSQ